jgi:2-oxoglutarate dehydrogenase E2 component (dihydrolipoamide succinyltransferase)
MVTNVLTPNASPAGAKLSVGRWFKRVGDPVSLDEPLVEINTDDLTREVRAPATGVLTTILVRDGQSVEPGALLGNISQF